MKSMITYINVYVPKLATSYMISNYQCPLPILRETIRGCLSGLEPEAEGHGRASMLDGGLATPICEESGVPLSTSSSRVESGVDEFTTLPLHTSNMLDGLHKPLPLLLHTKCKTQ